MDNHDVRMIAAGVATHIKRDVFSVQCVAMDFPRLVEAVEEQLRIELWRTGTKIDTP